MSDIVNLSDHVGRQRGVIEDCKAGEMREVLSDREMILSLCETVEALSKLVVLMARQLRASHGRVP